MIGCPDSGDEVVRPSCWGTALGPRESLEPDRDCLAGRGLGLVVVRGGAAPIDALGPDDTGLVGADGGAIDALPAVLSLDFVLESEVLAVVAGVPVRGVDAAELVEEIAFVGDLVRD